MKLSIIIPVFNEEKTIQKVLYAILALKIPKTKKDIIVIDDGSTDATVRLIKQFQHRFPGQVRFFRQKVNTGKGAAILKGIQQAKGEYVIIQDADLEYNPKDIRKLVEYKTTHNVQVVFGTRLKRPPHFTNEERTMQFLFHYFGNRMLSLLVSVLYGQWVTDMETGYKLFPRDVFKHITLHAKGFEFEPEITIKLLLAKYKIHEIPIVTNPRGYHEGKKIHTIQDGTKALKVIFHYRYTNKPLG